MKEKVEKYLALKEAEEQARSARIIAEEAIIAEIGCPEEGSKTHDVDGYKVTVTQRISRKLDEKAYALISASIPEELRPVQYVEVAKVDDRGCRWLAENQPGYWNILADCITEKPGKPGVKVQKVKA